MAHKRQLQIATTDTAALLAGIGCALTVKPLLNADIEYTLFVASQESLNKLDFRILGLLVQWIDIHDSYLNHPRLLRMVTKAFPLTQRFWKAVAQWKHRNRKWKSFLSLSTATTRFELLPAGTVFQIQRKGEDPRFAPTDLQIPNGLLRVRNEDILTKTQLIQFHRTYANRVRFGVCLRADLWSVLEEHPTLSASQLAKQIGCAFASAWEAKQDFELWKNSIDSISD